MFLPTTVKQYEKGLRFTFGKFSEVVQPGLRWFIPIVQDIVTVDMRQRTIDLQPQYVMTKDQVNLKIDGVVFYCVTDPVKAILNVSNLRRQIEDKATSELKEIIGKMSMQDTLSKRDIIANLLVQRLTESVSDQKTLGNNKDWGIIIKSVQINNVNLPSELVRAMAKQAEAEREKQARVTKAEGEAQASQKFREASKIYSTNPEAMKLRELQTYQEIGTEQNSLMIVIPQSMANQNGNFLIPMANKLLKNKR